MLTRLHEAELSVYLNMFWPAALDLQRSGYPTYTDGIKTRADWENHSLRAAREDWGEVLLYRQNGQPAGLITVDQVDEEYLSLPVCVCTADQPAMLEALVQYLKERYPGRRLWLGFAPENTERLAFARSHGFELLDDLVNWNLKNGPSVPLPDGVRAVTADNEEDFRRLWTAETIYWNADRIWAARDRWLLFVTDGAAVACMDEGSMWEVFGFAYQAGYDGAKMRRLLTACLSSSGGRPMTYFAGKEESLVLASLGFRRISGYVCYQKTL